MRILFVLISLIILSCSKDAEIVMPTSVSITSDKNTVLVGGKTKLNYSIYPENTTNKDTYKVEWTSSDRRIATVSTEGLVTAISTGEVEISAKIEGTSIINKYKITVDPIKIEKIVAEESELTITVGENALIKHNVLPVDATSKLVLWTSLDENIATVSNGFVKAVSEGSTKIKLSSADGSIETFVNVNVVLPLIQKITLSDVVLKMEVNSEVKLSYTISPEKVRNSNITWTSSNQSIATVDDQGKVKILGIGAVIITASSSTGVASTCAIQVLGAADMIEVSLKSTSAVVINGVYSGTLTAIISNNSKNSVKLLKSDLRANNNGSVSQSSSPTTIASKSQLSLFYELYNVNRPYVYLLFEMNGQEFEKIVRYL